MSGGHNISADAIAKARSVDIVSLVSRRVKLKRQGSEFWGLCPFHGERTPSFKVSRERGNFICFACCAKGDVIAWIRETEGLTFEEAVRHLNGDICNSSPTRNVERRAKQAVDPRIDRNRELALKIWAESKPVAGTIAGKYLSNRIGQSIDWPADLRFHPTCPRGDQKLPALVALLRDIRSDEPSAIQRIFLRDDGSDRLRDQMGKATLGAAAGAVCKLSPSANVTLGLGLAEGIESGLAIFSQGWRPMWITCGTSVMKSFPVLAGIDSFTVFADHDAAGQAAAKECAARWADAGVQARSITPKVPGTDWADAAVAA